MSSLSNHQTEENKHNKNGREPDAASPKMTQMVAYA